MKKLKIIKFILPLLIKLGFKFESKDRTNQFITDFAVIKGRKSLVCFSVSKLDLIKPHEKD